MQVDTEQVSNLQRALSLADWKLDLWKFAEAIGQDYSHQHTQTLFRALSDANKAINRFDAQTLTKILNAAQ